MLLKLVWILIMFGGKFYQENAKNLKASPSGFSQLPRLSEKSGYGPARDYRKPYPHWTCYAVAVWTIILVIIMTLYKCCYLYTIFLNLISYAILWVINMSWLLYGVVVVVVVLLLLFLLILFRNSWHKEISSI